LKNLVLIWLVLLSCALSAQENPSDSIHIIKKKKHIPGPRNASILSAIIPGGGQIYNHKYWKAPIVWAGMGGIGYLFFKNQKDYKFYQDNLRKLVAGDSSALDATGLTTVDQIQTQKLIYRKRRDLCGFGLIAIYAINIIDANVDAHLKTFDVSDDLSLQIKAKPIIYNGIVGLSFTAGLSFKLNFK
jgi:hypothetical protein